MKLEELQAQMRDGNIDGVDIMPNAHSTSEWLVMVKDKQGKSFFLIDDHEQVSSFHSLDRLIDRLRHAGVKRTKLLL